MTELLPMSSPSPRRPVSAKLDGSIGWLREEIDRLLDNFPFGLPARSLFASTGNGRASTPAMELVEKEGAYALSLELPGIDGKSVEIEMSDGFLTISGEKHAESETKDSGYLISEREYGAFCRQVSLPADTDPETIEASMRDGVLKIEIRKSKDAASKIRKIAIT